MVAQLDRMLPRAHWRASPANVVAAVLVVGAVLCAGLSLGTRLLGVEPFVTLFAVTSEQNVPTWYAVVLLMITGLIMVGVGALTPRSQPRLRWGWWVAALVLIALSIDELASLHERLGSYGASLVDASGLLHFAWVVPGLAVALVPVAALAYLGSRLPRPIAVELLAGLGIFLAAAFGLEMLGGLVLDQIGDGHLYALTATTEELLEMVGVIAMLHAAARMLVVARVGSGLTVTYAPPELPTTASRDGLAGCVAPVGPDPA